MTYLLDSNILIALATPDHSLAAENGGVLATMDEGIAATLLI